MLFLLSPAKTLDLETPVRAPLRRRATEPHFAAQAAELIDILRRKTPAEVASLMGLSDPLAALNVARYATWQPGPAPADARPAALAFAGDVYTGLQATTLSTAELDWAQQHLVILSGLYGALRPLDRLQPYRLEMGTALATARGRDLYAWWGDSVATYLNQRLEGEKAPLIVNLASVEYARVALRPSLAARVVECRFEDWKGGGYKLISFFAKRARGQMARYAIQHRVRRAQQLEGFDAAGYALAPEVSTATRLVFRRRVDG